MYFARVAVATALVALSVPAMAATVSSSASTTIPVPDNSATFAALGSGDSLSGYTEDGLIVSVAGTQFEPINVFGDGASSTMYFENRGNFSFVSISKADSTRIASLEFRKGSGFGQCVNSGGNGCSFVWQTFRNGRAISGGRVSDYGLGDYYRFDDAAGFEELRLASLSNRTSGFGDFQAIALADMRSVTAVPTVPLPAAAWFLVAGLGGLAAMSRRKG